MILVVGEILYDIFPNYKRLGGAPFNFAFHVKHLGFPVRFVSRVGDDAEGKGILETLEGFGFDLNDIQIDTDRPTGSVRVRLDENGVPDFDIVSDVAYDYIEFDQKVHAPMIHAAELVYYGSLIQRSEAGFKTIQEILSHTAPATRCFYDTNLRPACFNDAVVTHSLSRANVLKINKDERDEIKRILKYNNDQNRFLQHLMEIYPLEIVAMTKGDGGSEIFTKEGSFRVGSEKINKIVDSVGAGDGYAAMLATGILRQWHPDTIIHRASLFASQICTLEGAIPGSSSFYKPFTDMIQG
jgi:fructokinase